MKVSYQPIISGRALTLMIGWANLTNATAPNERSELWRGSGAEPQVRVTVSVRAKPRVYGWICKKSVFETFLFYAEVLVLKAATITVSNDALPYR